jgi:anti-anti-sigma factor
VHDVTEPDRLLEPLQQRDFVVDVLAEPRGTVVSVSGELDVASSQVLERQLMELQDVDLVVIDLRGLTFIDSTGLGVLVRAHQRAVEIGNRVALVRGNGQVNRLLTLTGLDEQLLIGDSAEQLLAAE